MTGIDFLGLVVGVALGYALGHVLVFFINKEHHNTNRWEKYYFTLPKSRDIIYKKLICNQVNHRLYYPNARKVVRNIYALNLG